MTLQELKEELQAKRDLLKQIFDEAKTGEKDEDSKPILDFEKVMGLGSAVNKLEGAEKAIRVTEIVKELQEAIADLDLKVRTKEAAEGYAASEKHFSEQRKRPAFPTAPAEARAKDLTFFQIARRVIEDPIFKAWRQGSRDGRIEVDAYWTGSKRLERKALMTTSAGFEPESTRTGVVVDLPLRPLQVVDIIPMGRTGQANVVYMEQTTRTQAAAEVAEGGAKPEATFVFTEQSAAVREIAVSIPVTDIQLEDVEFIGSMIETMLREDIDERLDSQIIVGDGIAPNLLGILNTSGIQTQAKGTDPIPDAIAKAGTLLRTGVARAAPTHVLLHPDDWDDVRLLRTADGEYLFGNPSQMVQPRIWGMPIVLNEALSAGTGLIGSFMPRNIQLVERRGIMVERGFVGNQFVENKQTIRAATRKALVVFRPAAFATVTGL